MSIYMSIYSIFFFAVAKIKIMKVLILLLANEQLCNNIALHVRCIWVTVLCLMSFFSLDLLFFIPYQMVPYEW